MSPLVEVNIKPLSQSGFVTLGRINIWPVQLNSVFWLRLACNPECCRPNLEEKYNTISKCTF